MQHEAATTTISRVDRMFEADQILRTDAVRAGVASVSAVRVCTGCDNLGEVKQVQCGEDALRLVRARAGREVLFIGATEPDGELVLQERLKVERAILAEFQ